MVDPGPERVGDEALARRARDGDTEALVALYGRYVREVYGYVYNQLGDAQDAEDVTSETFLHLVRGLGAFGGRSSFRTWMYVVARNVLRDHWRSEARRPTVGLDPRRHVAETDAAEGVARTEVTALGRAVLRELPENYRRVLELRVMEGRSVRDTAESLGLTESNVKVLAHRALKRAASIAAEWDQRREGDDDDER